MKVRVAYGLGTRSLANTGAAFGELVDALEELGFDSLWLSEQLTGDAPDPLIALGHAAGRTRRLKLGTSVVVIPGRNPVVLAKQMATLDRLSDGRFLPAVGLGQPTPVEHRAFGVRRADRADWFDEALGLMRRLWTEDDVTHHGERFDLEGVTLRPKPVQQPLEVWLGGRAPSELRRTGRLGDGWLASFATVADVERGWATITAAATEAGRTIDPEHLGVLIPYHHGPVDPRVGALLTRRRPDVDVADLVADGVDGLRARIEAMTAVGASKFVAVPLREPDDWPTELAAVRAATADLET